MNVLRQILRLLERRERWQLLGLGVAMLIMAALETVGVASIMPFMQLVTDPGVVGENEFLSAAYEWLGFESTESFLLAAGMAILVIIACSNGFAAFTTWLMARFTWGQSHRLSLRLLERYLTRPYAFFLDHNTSVLRRNVLSEVQNAVTGVLLPLLRICARSLVTLMILWFLAAVDVRLAGMMATVLGGAYGTIYLALRRRQHQLGQRRVQANGRRFAVTDEALVGIKELKVLGREREFLRRFKEPSWSFAQASASNQIVASLPRYAFETIAFGGMLLILLYQLRVEGDAARLVPVLGLYAFAGYRLMPALNELFTSVIHLRFQLPALEAISRDLGTGSAEGDSRSTADTVVHSLPLAAARAGVLRFRHDVRFEQVDYSYGQNLEPALRMITLAVRRLETVGIVGATGAGKTTLVDLLLGLLTPTSGRITVDGVPLDEETLPGWRRLCGYVPQEIFLSDDSIRGNIAFGIREDQIDDGAVERAARIAQIHDFVSELPDGYRTLVGERGVRLSGGQRQRIGIARALYHDPELLVLDEATNALDGSTEQAVISTLRTLAGQKTLVVIAHRLSTVRHSDTIHLIRDRELVMSGSYTDLLEQSPEFRAMAGVERKLTPLERVAGRAI